MKLIIGFLIIGFLASCSDGKKVVVGNKSTMEINMVYDAGNVVKGEIVNAKFKIKNTGDYPLVIAEVKGSCSCTVAEYPEEPLAPGEKATILAHVNTDKTGAGILNKSVSIVSNTEPSITRVVIKANVTTK